MIKVEESVIFRDFFITITLFKYILTSFERKLSPLLTAEIIVSYKAVM